MADSTLARLEANAAAARRFANETTAAAGYGPLAVAAADDEARHAEALVEQHRRIMAKADARGWK